MRSAEHAEPGSKLHVPAAPPAPRSLSPLAIQTRNLLEDPRCSVVVQMPGWTGLANARVTIFGEVYKLPESLQEQAQEVRGRRGGRKRRACCATVL